MDNTRFIVRSDMFGIYVFDSWYKISVRDGKMNVIRRPESKRDEIEEIVNEMNRLTADIPFDSGRLTNAA